MDSYNYEIAKNTAEKMKEDALIERGRQEERVRISDELEGVAVNCFPRQMRETTLEHCQFIRSGLGYMDWANKMIEAELKQGGE